MSTLNEKIIRQQTRLAAEVLDTLVPLVLEKRHPADRVLLRFFKGRRELGSRDRRFLSELFFSWFRWMGWVRPLELQPLEAAALSWLLDRTDLHPALESAVRNGWAPLGANSLGEKAAALASWFPDRPAPAPAALVFPSFAAGVDLPAGGEELLYDTLQTRPPAWLRLRNDAFKEVLAAGGIAFREHARLPGAVAVDAGAPLGPLGHGGQYEVQDVASQAVVWVAAPEPGSDWWDACAGAGGKTLQLADRVGTAGKVLATDIRPEALQECKKRARAGGVQIVRSQLHDLAKDNPFTKQFDGVLVDAPCSGWGIWSRNPDARWRSDPRDPSQKRNLQLKMLRNAVQCVKPGGVLIFAVCTFSREETVEVVARFQSEFPAFSLDSFDDPLTGRPTDGTLQIWPWEGPGDGMFMARFRRKTG